MYILVLAFPDWSATLFAISPIVILSTLILLTKLIPSIRHADGNGIDSGGATLVSMRRARVDLFIILIVPSQVDSA